MTENGLNAFAMLALMGCGRETPSDEEINALIDQRLAARGLAPLRYADGRPDARAPNEAGTSDADPPTVSLEFVARLDDLMKDYKPELPVVEDTSDLLRCVGAGEVVHRDEPAGAERRGDGKPLRSPLRDRGDVSRDQGQPLRHRDVGDEYPQCRPTGSTAFYLRVSASLPARKACSLNSALRERRADRVAFSSRISLFNQGSYGYRALPNMRKERLVALMTEFGKIVAAHAAFKGICVVL